MDWRQRRRKKELKHLHPTIQDALAVSKRIANGEKIVDGGVDRTPGRFLVQCRAITKSGKRCKNTTTSFTRLCRRHQKRSC